MKIRVRYFASLAELAGTDSETLDAPEGSTPASLWDEARARHPELRAAARPAFARNGEYVEPETILSDGDEVALLPPVSGG